MNFMDHTFQKDLRKAKLENFPDQRKLETPLDEVLWMLWVLRDHFTLFQARSSAPVSNG